MKSVYVKGKRTGFYIPDPVYNEIETQLFEQQAVINPPTAMKLPTIKIILLAFIFCFFIS